jgi:hypothetical protein
MVRVARTPPRATPDSVLKERAATPRAPAHWRDATLPGRLGCARVQRRRRRRSRRGVCSLPACCSLVLQRSRCAIECGGPEIVITARQSLLAIVISTSPKRHRAPRKLKLVISVLRSGLTLGGDGLPTNHEKGVRLYETRNIFLHDFDPRPGGGGSNCRSATPGHDLPFPTRKSGQRATHNRWSPRCSGAHRSS